jgi:hypothetical protein
MPQEELSFYDERSGTENVLQHDGQESILYPHPYLQNTQYFAPYVTWYHPYVPYFHPDEYDSYFSTQYFPTQHPPERPPGRPRRPERPRRPPGRPRPERPGRPSIPRAADPFGRVNVTGTYTIHMPPTRPDFTGTMALQQGRDSPHVRGYYIYHGMRGQGTFSGNLTGRMTEDNVLIGHYQNADGRSGVFQFYFVVGPPERFRRSMRGLFVEGPLLGTEQY